MAERSYPTIEAEEDADEMFNRSIDALK